MILLARKKNYQLKRSTCEKIIHILVEVGTTRDAGAIKIKGFVYTFFFTKLWHLISLRYSTLINIVECLIALSSTILKT